MKRLIIVMIAVFVCAMPFCVSAGAASPRKGSINVVMINKTDDSPLNNKTVNIIKVADCVYNPDYMKFNPSGDFAGVKTDITDSDAPAAFYSMAVSKGIKGTAIKTDAQGKASLTGCEFGAYLIYSPENLFNPFIVFVPMVTEEEIIFDITAVPKIDTEVTEPPPEKPSTDKPSVPSSNPTVPTDTTKGSESHTDEPSSSKTPTTKDTNTPTGKTSYYITTTTKPYNNNNTPGAGAGTPVTNGSASIPILPYTPGEHTTRTPVSRETVTRNSEESTTVSPTEKLPQTGMLQYPVPILGFAGIILFLTGFVIYGEGRKKED